MPGQTATADKAAMKKAQPERNGLNAANSYALPEEIRTAAEGKYGVDMDVVRVHDDDIANLVAAMLSARAVTHGSDIYLGEGESVLDEELMDHELSHVAEQADTGPAFAAWSLPVHNMIMKDAFFKAMYDLNPGGRYQHKSDLLPDDRERLKQLRAGSSWNDLMESLDHWLVPAGLLLSSRMKKEENLSNESHHGVLQFIHAQGEKEKTMADIARNMKDWGRFCYNVYLGQIRTYVDLSTIAGEYPFLDSLLVTLAAQIRYREEGAEQRAENREAAHLTVAQLFNNKEFGEVKNMALGSFLHMVMDSFNQAHGQRTAGKRKIQKPQTQAEINARKAPQYMYVAELKNMTDYELQQDHVKGDITVTNKAVGPLKMAFKDSKSKSQTIGYDDSVDVCAEIIRMANAGQPWERLEEYMDAVFKVEDEADATERTLVAQGGKQISGDKGEAKMTMRGVPAQGRLFRKGDNSIATVVGNYLDALGSLKKKDLGDAVYKGIQRWISQAKKGIKTYSSLVKDRVKKLNLIISNEDRTKQLTRHQQAISVISEALLALNPMIPEASQSETLRELYELAYNEVNADMLDIRIDLRSLEREKVQRAADAPVRKRGRWGGVKVM